MTRMFRRQVACPFCQLRQSATIVYSWNEFKSGPAPPDVFTATCGGCGEQFDPYPNQLDEPEPRERGDAPWWAVWRR